jgi:hypothetical protein
VDRHCLGRCFDYGSVRCALLRDALIPGRDREGRRRTGSAQIVVVNTFSQKALI